MKKIIPIVMTVLFFASCKKDAAVIGKDINTAEKVSVDRFSAVAGHLMVRSATNGMPAANAAVNFSILVFGLE